MELYPDTRDEDELKCTRNGILIHGAGCRFNDNCTYPKCHYAGNLLLTKEAFENHALTAQENLAREYGITLEEWREAVIKQQTIIRKDDKSNK
jgi:hypothetical protein